MKPSPVLMAFCLSLSTGLCLAGDRSPRQVLQDSTPFLETYWESYDSWPYDYSSCYTQTPNE